VNPDHSADLTFDLSPTAMANVWFVMLCVAIAIGLLLAYLLGLAWARAQPGGEAVVLETVPLDLAERAGTYAAAVTEYDDDSGGEAGRSGGGDGGAWASGAGARSKASHGCLADPQRYRLFEDPMSGRNSPRANSTSGGSDDGNQHATLQQAPPRWRQASSDSSGLGRRGSGDHSDQGSANGDDRV